jgi:hypothetical protein
VLDGRPTAPATAGLVGAGRGLHGDQGLLRIVITEGRKRQVRHVCEAIGHPVVRLRRVQIGPIKDKSLRPGQFRDLTPGEVTALRCAVALAEPSAEHDRAANAPSRKPNAAKRPKPVARSLKTGAKRRGRP